MSLVAPLRSVHMAAGALPWLVRAFGRRELFVAPMPGAAPVPAMAKDVHQRRMRNGAICSRCALWPKNSQATAAARPNHSSH